MLTQLAPPAGADHHDPVSLVASLRATLAAASDAQRMDIMLSALRAADALTAVAVEAIARLAATGAIERLSGLGAEQLVGLGAARPRWEAVALVEASSLFRSMPRLAQAFTDGKVSWAAVRAIGASVRRADAPARTVIDGMVAHALARTSDIEPDALIQLVDDEIARRRPDLTLAREDRAIERSFLSLQPRLDGMGGRLYGEADAASFATISEAVDASSPRPGSDDEDPTSRARQRMQGLVAACEAALGGGGTLRPRPRFVVHADIRDLEAGARIDWPARGQRGRLSRIATEMLACDAEFRAIIFDGARPIAVSDIVGDPSPKARAALAARDGGCRFPGCSMPVAWTDAHHINGRGPGRTRSIDDLVLLCRRCHRRVHRHCWRILPRSDGTITFLRRGGTCTSLPRAPARE